MVDRQLFKLTTVALDPTLRSLGGQSSHLARDPPRLCHPRTRLEETCTRSLAEQNHNALRALAYTEVHKVALNSLNLILNFLV